MEETKKDELVSCLRNERVIVRFVPKEGGMIQNPKHVLYGGMSERSVRYFTVPVLSSTGAYKNVLTDKEKEYLEMIMGLEYNALSIYRKENNFWSNFTVRLTKQDTYLDLSDPNDYIKYKVLKANSDTIADSLETLQDKPKATYQFVLIKEGETENRESENISTIMKCYKEYGKIEDNADILKCIVELLDKRPMAKSVKIEFLRGKCNSLIQADPKTFYSTITDSLLPAKALIKKAVDNGLISRKANQYFLKENNLPLCGDNEEPTLSNAARFLNLPKNQELKFNIEAKLKEH